MKKLLALLIIILVTSIFAFFLSTASQHYPKTLVVNNLTCSCNKVAMDMFDEYVRIIAYDIFKIDTIEIEIKYMPREVSDYVKQTIMLGYVTEDAENPYKFYIFISKRLPYDRIKMVVSHEMIHIRQMYYDKLVELPDGMKIWIQDTVDVINTPYNERPWEIEAYADEEIISHKIDSILETR